MSNHENSITKQTRAKNARETRLKRKIAGLCARCPSKAVIGTTACQPCHNRQNAANSRRYHAAVRSGSYTPNKTVMASKAIVMKHYGPGCKKCGIIHLSMLTIDHINDDGAKHRKSGRNTGTHLYRKLIKSGFPDGYQCLCWNCNFEKLRTLQIAKHSKIGVNIRNRISKTKLRLAALTTYGRKCACCGIDNLLVLNIDHIDNDGAVERKKIGDGSDFYRWLKKTGYPSGYQVLCYNCNCSRHIMATCEHLNG